ncbi:MAG: hypothetical protein KJ826_07650 [Proteobacteria bacterium]|nr:hypothetical protein [Pseudomonadota bacterium]
MQDCEGVSTSSNSIDAVKRALSGDKQQFVYGPNDPFNRKADVQNLRSSLNKKGQGEIVHGWIDADSKGYANFHRERFVWLVLNDKVYPLHTNASMALSRLFDGVPDSILKKAGLVHSYERGKTILDQLKMEEHSFKRFQAGSGGQPFPNCSEK